MVGRDAHLVGAQHAGQIGQRGHAVLAGIVTSGCATDAATGLLDGVQHEALAEHRRQHPLGEAGRARLLDDVPLEEPPVAAHQRMVVVVDADRALQPPVRRVQGVGVVAAGEPQPGGAQLGLQLGGRVDAHVAADRGRRVVLVGQHPVDLLGQPRRHGGRERAARSQHAHQLGDAADVVGDVLEHLRRDDGVEAPSANGSRVASPRSTPT